MSVTVNLFQALWALRYPDRDRIVWVDAICINQEDVKERGHQVAQMTSIYKNAEKVVVWLGRSDLDTGSVFRHMRQLEKVATEHAYHDWEVSDRRWQDLWSTAKPMLDEESTNWLHQQRRGLESIFRQPWFTRVWIIQEIANARSATIMCGTAVVSSRVFAAMPSLVGIVLDPHCQTILDIMPGSLRKHSWWAQNRDLHTLLLKFRWSKASDPRDAIYALVGISSDACNSKCLVPDYELSEDDVVRNTMAFILRFRDPEIPPPPLPNCDLQEFLEDLEFIGSRLTPWAVETGNVVLASQLLSWREFNGKQYELGGERLLRSAVKNGHAEIARLLHDMENCNINEVNGDKRTLLFRAAMDGDAKSLKVLLDTDRAALDTKDKNGQTAFTAALENGNWVILEMLLNNQATGDRNSISASMLQEVFSQGGQSAVINLLLELPGVARWRKKHIQKQLFRAAKEGIECDMGLLLDLGEADINGKNEDGATPLLLATQNGHDKIVKLLLKAGNAELCERDKDGCTPFFSAVRNWDVTIVKLLTEAYNPTSDTHNICAGEAPLISAIKYGNPMIVEVLLKSGKFNLNEKDHLGRTPLMSAVLLSQAATVEVLLSAHNMEVDAEDNDKHTALSWAAQYGEKMIVQQLLQTNEANANHKDRDGLTPLSWAEKYGHIEILRMLLESKSADRNDKDFVKRSLKRAGENSDEWATM